MLKMYHRHARDGGSPGFWDELWSDGRFEEALRFCEIDPIRHIFETHAKAGQLMLEGGCGRGQYVAYQSSRGVRVVGLDFARGALADLHRWGPDLALCAGEVQHLPFRDGCFDVYYSGGVVEHFESGAGPALEEARRVLCPNGTLLVSVPYLSPLRNAISLFRRKTWRRVSDSTVEPGLDIAGRRFFQYAYSPAEFKRLLAASGFSVRSMTPYAVIWGLFDIPGVARILGGVDRGRRIAKTACAGQGAESGCGAKCGCLAIRLPLLKRLLVAEDESMPLAGIIVHGLRWAFSNMMIYVCARDDRGGGSGRRMRRGRSHFAPGMP